MDVWKNGPKFLYDHNDQWPLDISKNYHPQEEIKHNVHHHQEIITRPDLLNVTKFSSWKNLRKMCAYMFRFINNIKNASQNKEKQRRGPLTADDFVAAENYLFQNDDYKYEMHELRKDRIVNKESNLHSYTPYIDENGVIRSRGRIENIR